MQKNERIVELREAIILPYIKNRALSVVLTIYKEYKKNIRRNIERIYCSYIFSETNKVAMHID